MLFIILIVSTLMINWWAFCKPVRPMFHNYYGRNDHMLFSRWIWQAPAYDRLGNYAVADYELNLLVIVLAMDPDGLDIYPYKVVDEDKAIIGRGTSTPRNLHVSRERNQFIVFSADGTKLDTSLDPGMAQIMFQAMRREVPESLISRALDVSNNQDLTLFLRDSVCTQIISLCQ